MGSSKHLAVGVQQLPAADADEVRSQLRQVPGDGLFQQLGIQAGVLGLHRHGGPKNIFSLGKEMSRIIGAMSTWPAAWRLSLFDQQLPAARAPSRLRARARPS